MPEIREQMRPEDTLLMSRALRQKEAGAAIYDFTLKQLVAFYGLGQMDQIDVELGVVVRITPDEEKKPEPAPETTDAGGGDGAK